MGKIDLNSIEEIMKKIESGMATIADAAYLRQLIANLLNNNMPTA